MEQSASFFNKQCLTIKCLIQPYAKKGFVFVSGRTILSHKNNNNNLLITKQMKRIYVLSGLILAMFLSVGLHAQSQRNLPCLKVISGLNDDQKQEITTLENDFQTQMSEFRAERRSTIDVNLKNQILDEMQVAQNTHRSQVLKLLNETQKEQYLSIQGQGNRPFYKNKNSIITLNRRGKGNLSSNRQGNRQVGNCTGNCRSSRGQGKYRVNNYN